MRSLFCKEIWTERGRPIKTSSPIPSGPAVLNQIWTNECGWIKGQIKIQLVFD